MKCFQMRKERKTALSSPEISAEESALLLAAEIGRNVPQIDLHGATAEEARTALDSFLYAEFRKGTRAVKIIHGKGTGVLGVAVREELARHNLVEAWRPAERSEEMNAVAYAVLYESVFYERGAE